VAVRTPPSPTVEPRWPSNIDIRFETREDGARLTYTTDDPQLIAALHRWGDAQVSDHGDHAEHTGHTGHGN
jgi:hypothetical protein